MLKMKHFVVMTHLLKSIGLLERGSFFIFIGYFNRLWLEYPIFYAFMKHLDLNANGCKYNYWRLTTDSNLLSWGLEPIRDNSGNIISFSV